jgi:hypothetical protein
MRRLAALALAALGAAGAASAEDAPRVEATASKTEPRLGERFTVELKATAPAGTTFTFPERAGNEAVELRAAPPDAATPPPPGVRRYEATAFAPGEVELPPVEVAYRLPDGTQGTAASPPLALRVESVLPKDPKRQELVDIRGPVALSVGAAFWTALGALALAAAALIVWLRSRRRPAAAPAAAPPSPPDAEALGALERLAAAGFVERGDFRGYYIALAEIAKRYLEGRLGAPVLEMTSAETAAFLRDHPLAAPFAAAVREMAGAADHVKFARGAGLEAEARRHLDAVRGLVRGLEERLRPAAEEKVA